MRHFGFGGSLIAAIALAGCGSGGPGPGHGGRHGGRYVGIGLYSPGQMWPRMVGAARSGDESAATLHDDEQVIVVVDSQTGEIRQCGNLSGHCLRMNPWSGQPAPASLSEHAADIDRTDQAAPATRR